MSTNRTKRLTLRFYLDDPDSHLLYERLQQRRKETGIPMSTLALKALQQALNSDEDELKELRAMFREELRSAFREWSFAVQPPVQQGKVVEQDNEDNYDLDDLHELTQNFSF